MHLKSVSLMEAKNLLFGHIDTVIFDEHEIHSLQSLLADYRRIVSDYGYPVGNVKSHYVKSLLVKEYKDKIVKEYKDKIGFKERSNPTMREWVYDVWGGSEYIEATMSVLHISEELLIRHLAPQLSEKIKGTRTVPWPPHIDHLEEGEQLCEMLAKLLTWLKQPEIKTVDISPATLSLASMIQYHITKRHTTTAINLGLNGHGMTRSKDLVDTLHSHGTRPLHEEQ